MSPGHCVHLVSETPFIRLKAVHLFRAQHRTSRYLCQSWASGRSYQVEKQQQHILVILAKVPGKNTHQHVLVIPAKVLGKHTHNFSQADRNIIFNPGESVTRQ